MPSDLVAFSKVYDYVAEIFQERYRRKPEYKDIAPLVLVGELTGALERMPLSALSQFDMGVRRHCFNYTSDALVDDVLSSTNKEDQAALKVLCCHPSGYVRHDAIGQLATLVPQEAIPFLLLRLLDWVAEVRGLSTELIRPFLRDKHDLDWMVYFPLIEDTRRKIDNLKALQARGYYVRLPEGEVDVIHEIEQYLVQNYSAQLMRQLNHEDTRSVRYSFAILKQDSRHHLPLLDCALDCHDLSTRLQAFKLVKQSYNADDYMACLCRYKDDKQMAVRKHVLYSMIELAPAFPQDTIVDALYDRSVGVRQVAQFFLKQDKDFDLLGHYREVLVSRSKPLHHAITGLGDCADQSDFKYIRPFISIETPRIRAAVFAASLKLKPKDWKSIVAPFLKAFDISSVRKAFEQTMRDHPGSCSIDDLIEMTYDADPLLHTLNMMRLYRRAGCEQYPIIKFALSQYEDFDQEVKEQFLHYLTEPWGLAFCRYLPCSFI